MDKSLSVTVQLYPRHVMTRYLALDVIPPLRFLGLQYALPLRYRFQYLPPPKSKFDVNMTNVIFCVFKTESLENFRLRVFYRSGVVLSGEQPPAARCVGA